MSFARLHPSFWPGYAMHAAPSASSQQQSPNRRLSSLSFLSPFQVKNAQFTPSKAPQPAAAQDTMGAPSSASVDSSSSVSQRLERQETRLRELEDEIKRLQQYYESQSLASPGVPSPRSTEPIADLLAMDAEEDGGDAVTSSNLQALSEVYYTPPQSKASSTAVTSSPGDEDDLHYQADNLDAFESHLNSTSRIVPSDSGATAPVEVTNGGDPCGTLLEGIGSLAEITLHRKVDDQKTRKTARPEPQPWDRTISWKAGTAQSEDENEDGGGIITSSGQMYPKTLDAGVVFVPSEWDDNVYRTVTLHNLPLDIKMKTLFKGLLGGEVYSAHLMNMESVAGSHMGIVTFVNEKSARGYAQFAAKYGVYFNDQRASVSLLKTATYPMAADTDWKIFKQGYTRCLSVRGPADSNRYGYILEHIQTRLPMYFNLGESIVEDDAETEIIVRMNSVKAAFDIMQSLKAATRLSDCEFDFAADPCAAPLPGSKAKNEGRLK